MTFAPLGADSMDDKTRLQITCWGDYRVAYRARPDAVAFFLNGWPPFTADRSSHACTKNQVWICGIDDSIGCAIGDIALFQMKAGIIN